MITNTLLFFIIVCFLSDFSHGQRDKEIFQNDYTNIKAVNSSYKIHATPKSWFEARRECAQEGASLFYPENEDEQNAVMSFRNRTQPGIKWVFLGISDLASEGVFKTVDGKLVSEVYNNWKFNEPNDNNGDEDCVEQDNAGKMNDCKCSTKFSFICKKSSMSLQQNNSYNKDDLTNKANPNDYTPIDFTRLFDPEIEDDPFEGILDSEEVIDTIYDKLINEFLWNNYTHIEAVNSSYKMHATPKSWFEARRECAQEGASLFYPENEDEQNAVMSFRNRTRPDIKWVFLGISDLTSEGVFKTVDGKLVSEVYNNWKFNEPNDNNGDEDCVEQDNSGKMNDCKCSTKFSFICKKSPMSPQQNNSYNKDDLTNKEFYKNDYALIDIARLFDPEIEDDPFEGILDSEEVIDTNYDEKANEYLWNKYTHIEAVNSSYMIHATPKTWFEARRECAQEGASLFYPENEEEQNAVMSFRNRTKPGIKWVFLGISDLASEGVFKTVDGKLVSEVYNNWKFNEPNDNNGDEDCVEQDNVGKMNDCKCSTKFSFICKKSPMSLQQNNSYNKDDLTNKANQNDYTPIDFTRLFDPEIEDDPFLGILDSEEVIDTIYDELTNEFLLNDYTHIEAVNSSYKIHTTPKTWFEARRECAQEGASLFYPENEEEQNAVMSFRNRTRPDSKWVFLGISDLASEGVFETVDGKLVSEVYNNWKFNEPNDKNGDEDCVEQDNVGKMNDCKCSTKFSFICKKHPMSLQQNNSYNKGKSESKVYNKNWKSDELNDTNGEDCVEQDSTDKMNDCKKSLPVKRNNSCNIDYSFNKNIGKCYKLHNTPLKWTSAYAVCRAEQSHLALINNRFEADYLAKLTESASNQRIGGNTQFFRGIYHLGFHYRFKEGWQTVRGTAFTVDDDVWWDNQYPIIDEREQCGSMFYNGRLHSVDCNTKSFFICEHESTLSKEMFQ